MNLKCHCYSRELRRDIYSLDRIGESAVSFIIGTNIQWSYMIGLGAVEANTLRLSDYETQVTSAFALFEKVEFTSFCCRKSSSTAQQQTDPRNPETVRQVDFCT